MTNHYSTLGVSKNASDAEIKKAYRKYAMKYHPDRNKGNKNSEKKFKEINEAYSILGDKEKKKQYDNPMGGFDFGGGNGSFGNQGFSGGGFGNQGFDFGDIFGGAGRQSSRQQTSSFDFSDLFGSSEPTKKQKPKKEETLDVEKIYKVSIFDLILGTKIEVVGPLDQKAKLKIPELTKPGTKFRLKGFGRQSGKNKGNLYIKIEAIMPKNISDVDKSMLENIKNNVGY